MVREQLGMLSQAREIRAGGITWGVVSMLLVFKAVRCGQPREWVSIRKKRSPVSKGPEGGGEGARGRWAFGEEVVMGWVRCAHPLRKQGSLLTLIRAVSGSDGVGVW